jgi:hypothetical protein
MTEKISSFESNPLGWGKNGVPFTVSLPPTTLGSHDVFRLEDGLEYFGAVIGTFLAIF